MRAFALKEAYDVATFGGSMALPPDSRTMDVGALLRKHGGTLVTDDPTEGEALAMYPALYELAEADYDNAVRGWEQNTKLVTDEPEPPVAEVTKADLADQARKLGLGVTGTKQDIADRIAAAESAGDGGGD